MKLIVGLGNPGPKYQNSRHNMGFLVLQNLQQYLEFEPFKEENKFDAIVSNGQYEDQKIILAMPLTYMNKSGLAIQKIAQFYKIPPEDILVLCDDLDTPYEKLRLRKNGGPGTHNGLKSIVEAMGQDFPRLRIGIESRGETSHSAIETTDFVLGNFNTEETVKLGKIIDTAIKAIEAYLKEGIESSMNKFNS